MQSACEDLGHPIHAVRFPAAEAPDAGAGDAEVLLATDVNGKALVVFHAGGRMGLSRSVRTTWGPGIPEPMEELP